MCSFSQMVVYRGKGKLKDLVRFVDKEMEKAKKYREKVNHLLLVSANDVAMMCAAVSLNGAKNRPLSVVFLGG